MHTQLPSESFHIINLLGSKSLVYNNPHKQSQQEYRRLYGEPAIDILSELNEWHYTSPRGFRLS